MIDRRSFIGRAFSAIAAFVAGPFARTASSHDPNQPPYRIDSERRIVNPAGVPGATITNWIAVKERRPRFGEHQHGEKLLRVKLAARSEDYWRASNECQNRNGEVICIGSFEKEGPGEHNATWKVNLPGTLMKYGMQYQVTHWAELPPVPQSQ